VTVCVLFVLALASADPTVAHVLDCLHWTVAYVAAAVVAWLGVADASGADRAARRWFAIGLTSTAVGDLLYNYDELTGQILVPQLNDTLFLLLGPCFLLGLATAVRADDAIAARAPLDCVDGRAARQRHRVDDVER
jgi:hypothetical protein